MENRSKQSGQSVIEYIMLLAVVGTLLVTVLNSSLVKDLLGPNSGFFASVQNYMSVTYQYGSYRSGATDNYSSGDHDLYKDPAGGSRFWGVISSDP